MLQAVFLISVLILSAATIVGLWWRYAARRRSLPCPSWLSLGLEKLPFSRILSETLPSLDRLNLHPGMQVLDVGCGTGRLSISVAKAIGPTGQVIALDIQPAMLQELRERIAASGLTNIRAVLGDIAKTTIGHNAFDLVLLVTVLGEIPERDQSASLGTIHSALKPGGILSVTEVFPDPHYQNRGKVRRLVEAAGFRLNRQYGNWLAFTMNFVKTESLGDL